MMYKNKNDIPFILFQELTKNIEGFEDDTEFVANEIVRLFYPNVKEHKEAYSFLFAEALNAPCKPKKNFRVNMDLEKTAGIFIDCDTFINDGQLIEMFKIVLGKKYSWSKKLDVERISIADAEYVLQLFINALPKLKSDTNGYTTPLNS